MNEPCQPNLAVDVHNLTRVFRGKPALVRVNLQVPIGSVFGLVGLNGAVFQPSIG